MVSGPLDVVILMLIGAAVAWIIFRSFTNPRGVYKRSLAGFGIAFAAILASACLASLFISDAAGLGVVLIVCALITFAAAVSLLAALAASLRHVWDRASRG